MVEDPTDVFEEKIRSVVVLQVAEHITGHRGPDVIRLLQKVVVQDIEFKYEKITLLWFAPLKD